tara:strand:- start:769 stop:1248 length:480 start_codon:yes stop_codon:yes gene_type:complete
MSNNIRNTEVPFPYDINIFSYLSIIDSKKIKILSKKSKHYVYHNKFNIFTNAANVIKKFLKHAHNLFEFSKRELNHDILFQLDEKNKYFSRIKFLTINLLYITEYNLDHANSFIKGQCTYKQSLVDNVINVDKSKKYSKYDLNYVLSKLHHEDISYIGI